MGQFIIEIENKDKEAVFLEFMKQLDFVSIKQNDSNLETQQIINDISESINQLKEKKTIPYKGKIISI